MTVSASTTSQLPKKFDPSTFQWSLGGKVFPLETLSREDLLQVACEGMCALERLENLQLDMAQVMSDWRDGRITPDEDGDAAG